MSRTTCSHQAQRSEWIDPFVNDWGVEEPGEWKYSVESTTEDVDLHRYRCTQCGKIFYYSGRARDFYEKSIESPWIKGLHK